MQTQPAQRLAVPSGVWLEPQREGTACLHGAGAASRAHGAVAALSLFPQHTHSCRW